MSPRSPLSVALVVVVGCVGSKELARGDELAMLHGTVDERLAAGTVEIFGTSERGREGHEEALAMAFESFPTRSGTLLHVFGTWSGVPVDAFAMHTANVVRPLPKPAASAVVTASATATSRFAPVDDGGIYVRCTQENTSTGLLLAQANAALVAVSPADAARLCAGAIGPSSLPGRIATARSVGEKIVLSSLRLDASGAVIADGSTLERTPTGQPAQGAFFVEETSSGVFAYAATVTGSWVYERTDAVTPQITTALETYPDPRQVRRTTSGALQVFLHRPGDRFVEWRVQADGGSTDLATATPEAGADWPPSWRLAGGFGEATMTRLVLIPGAPGSSSDPVFEPTEVRVRVLSVTGDALVSSTFPASPCVVRAACREVGESYFLGVSGEEKSRVGIYLLWGWRGAMTIVAAPAIGRAAP